MSHFGMGATIEIEMGHSCVLQPYNLCRVFFPISLICECDEFVIMHIPAGGIIFGLIKRPCIDDAINHEQ